MVEEQALGNPEKASAMYAISFFLKQQLIFCRRAELMKSIGTDLDVVRPGSPQALELLRILTEERGISRHYLGTFRRNSAPFLKFLYLASIQNILSYFVNREAK